MKMSGTQNTVCVDQLHWDFGLPILYCFNHNVTQILVNCMSHISLLYYDNPQEKHHERLHTTNLLACLENRNLISRGTLVFARMDIVINTDKCEYKLVYVEE